MRPLSIRMPPSIARSASALCGRDRSSGCSRIGSGVAMKEQGSYFRVSRVISCSSWIAFLSPSGANKTTLQVLTYSVELYNTRSNKTTATLVLFSRFSVCFRFRLGRLLRQFGLLFGRQMTDDNLTLRRDFHLKIKRYFTV